MRASIAATLFGAGFVIAMAVVGCGKNDSGGAGTKDQFISQLCAEFADCCKAAGRPADGAQCRAFYGAFAPMSGYDQTAASACLDEVRAAGSDKCAAASGNTPSCRKVFQSGGTKKPGEACQTDSDCAPAAMGESTCAIAFVGGGTVQQCQTQLVGKVGSSPCVATIEGDSNFSGGGDQIPASGYTCNIADGVACDDVSGACTALGAVGEACASGFYPCVAGAYCSQSMCQERAALGAACSFDGDCVEGAYCPSDGQTCTALRAAGEACASGTECASSDCTNKKCGAQNDLTLTFLCGTN